MLTARDMTGRGGTDGPGGGLTLLELLIAIAMVSLLVAILAPSLTHLHASAELAICKTRLHNTGRALAQHTTDADIRFPVSDYLNSTHKVLIDALVAVNGEVNQEDFYCPAETDPSRINTYENFKEGRIGYFYYSCKWASFDADISGFLRYDVSWPRMLTREMLPDTWVMSDSWFRGRKTAHTAFKKGVNYLTINGDVSMVESSPSGSFK